MNHGISDVVLVDAGQPMAFTSAQSGDNYRNWWPHPAMVAFTNRSIDLMERIARRTGNRIDMTRRGYAAATRETDIDDLVEQLQFGFGDPAGRSLRVHSGHGGAGLPRRALARLERRSRRRGHPVQRASDQRGLPFVRSGSPDRGSHSQGRGHRRAPAWLVHARGVSNRRRTTRDRHGRRYRRAEWLRPGSPHGPTGSPVSRPRRSSTPPDRSPRGSPAMLGVNLPVHNTLQQKIAFEDSARAIPRDMPFSIDLDRQTHRLDRRGTRDAARGSGIAKVRCEEMPGAIHCRPDGGDHATRVKLGWAFNERTSAPAMESTPRCALPRDRPARRIAAEPVARALSRKCCRSSRHHYGGWYTMTVENWPLIGPMGPEGAFMNCAHSGFGTMAACAGGELCAAWTADAPLPRLREGVLAAPLRRRGPDGATLEFEPRRTLSPGGPIARASPCTRCSAILESIGCGPDAPWRAERNLRHVCIQVIACRHDSHANPARSSPVRTTESARGPPVEVFRAARSGGSRSRPCLRAERIGVGSISERGGLVPHGGRRHGHLVES